MARSLKLILGNKNYSSWSLRPWLLLKYFKIPFQEVVIPLYEGDFKKKIAKVSPSEKVPALIDGTVTVWESLAICQYVADLYPKKALWPKQRADRALAYAISHEMHSGFGQLRKHMPMNIRGCYPGKGRTPEVEKDIARIIAIWKECRKKFCSKGDFLFGNFTIADAMYAPVVTRFRTYGVDLKGSAADYAAVILELPEFKEWEGASTKEKWLIAASEIYNQGTAFVPVAH